MEARWIAIMVIGLGMAVAAIPVADALKADHSNLYRQEFRVSGDRCFVPVDGGEPFCFHYTNPQGE